MLVPMASPLVATKLFIPKQPAAAVQWPRLGARLDVGGSAKLTLVSAPAGFGKTTLLAEWLEARSNKGAQLLYFRWIKVTMTSLRSGRICL